MKWILFLLFPTLLTAGDAWDQLAEISRKPPAEARVGLEQLLVRDPGFVAARFNLGTLLLESDPSKAAEQLELAVSSASGELAANAWHNLALARFQQGRLDDALRAAERAAQLDPTAGGLRDEIRRVTLARLDEARRKADEEARKLHLDPVPLPDGRVGEVYAATLALAGGSPPRTVALAGASKMPEGISLAADGSITGTPRAAGTTKLDLALSDQVGGKATGSVEVRILPQPAITTEILPEAIIGQPYEARFATVGFPGSPTWSIAALPAGLTAGADGVIHGTPSETGTSTLHVHAEAGKLTANRLIDLEVSNRFAPAEVPLPPATATAPYQHRTTVRGPAQQYRWSVAADAAMGISPDGTISGTPAEAGTMTLPATITAGDQRRRQVELTLPVNPVPLIQPEPIQLQAGAPANQAITVAGGTPPYAWSVVSGLLPAGLRLDPNGRLGGVAKDPGTSTITVAVQDRWKAGTQAEVQITVAPASDPPPKDQEKEKDKDKDKDKDQTKQDQDKQDGQKTDQSAQDQQKQDPSKQDGQKPEQSDQKPDQSKQDGQQGSKDQAQAKQDQSAGQNGDDGQKDAAAAQAAAMQQTAADHWLDQLPEERRDTLRYQLLDGGQKKPTQQGKTW